MNKIFTVPDHHILKINRSEDGEIESIEIDAPLLICQAILATQAVLVMRVENCLDAREKELSNEMKEKGLDYSDHTATRIYEVRKMRDEIISTLNPE